jgi:hypothetical protein
MHRKRGDEYEVLEEAVHGIHSQLGSGHVPVGIDRLYRL